MYRFNYIQKLQQRKHTLNEDIAVAVWCFRRHSWQFIGTLMTKTGRCVRFKREKKGKAVVVGLRSGSCDFVYCAQSCPRWPVVGV